MSILHNFKNSDDIELLKIICNHFDTITDYNTKWQIEHNIYGYFQQCTNIDILIYLINKYHFFTNYNFKQLCHNLFNNNTDTDIENIFKITKYLYETQTNIIKTDTLFKIAILSKNIKVIKYITSLGYQININDMFLYGTCEVLCKCDIDIITYLGETQADLKNILKSCYNTIYFATTYNNIDLLKYLKKTGVKEYKRYNFDINLETLQYIHKNFVLTNINPIDSNVNLKVFKYIIENKLGKVNINTWNIAIKNGNLDIIKYLFENKLGNCTKTVMKTACSNNKLEIVKYLDEINCPYNLEDMFKLVCHKKYNELVSYFHEKKLLEIKYNLDKIAYLNFLKSLQTTSNYYLQTIKDKFLYECIKKALENKQKNIDTLETEFLNTLTAQLF
jgi:hypothetical protein